MAAPDDREQLKTYLATHDTRCPSCGYNLRGVEATSCPECGRALALGLRTEDAWTRWDGLAVIAVVMSTLYFMAMGGLQVAQVFRAAWAGPTLASVRGWLLVYASSELFMALLCVVWCVVLWVERGKKPRPMWGRPTTAAAGILLATFVVYLVMYGMRAVLF